MAVLSRMLCKVGVHDWRPERNLESGLHYLVCRRCGKEKDTMSIVDIQGMG